MDATFDALARDGFVLLRDAWRAETDLLALARRLGVPKPPRPGRAVVRVLTPEDANPARANTLTGRYGSGAFPLHTEAAFWRTPPRFVLLACDTAGAGERPTLLCELPGALAALDAVLRRVPWLVDARPRFLANVITAATDGARYRLDLDCMAPASAETVAVVPLVRAAVSASPAIRIEWARGDVAIVDNRRVAHGRGSSGTPDVDRRLLRILIE